MALPKLTEDYLKRRLGLMPDEAPLPEAQVQEPLPNVTDPNQLKNLAQVQDTSVAYAPVTPRTPDQLGETARQLQKGLPQTEAPKVSDTLKVSRETKDVPQEAKNAYLDLLLEATKNYKQDTVDQREGVQSQLQGLNRLREIPAEVDLTNAYRGLEGLYGKKFSTPYNAPKSPQEYGIDMAKLENAIQGQRGKTTLADIAGIKALIPANDYGKLKEAIDQFTGIGPKGGGGQNKEVLNYDKWVNQVNKSMLKDDELSSKLGTILTELKAGNPVDDARISVIRATMDAGGRPNIAEVRTEAGSKALVDRAVNAYTYLTTGNMSDKNRDLIIKSLHDMSDYRQMVRSASAKRLTQMAPKYGVDKSGVNAALPPTYVNKYPVTPPKAPDFQKKDTSKMTPEQKAAYKEELKKFVGQH